PGLAHERGIGREALDQGVLEHLQHAGLIGAVGEELYLELHELARMMPDASRRPEAIQSGMHFLRSPPLRSIRMVRQPAARPASTSRQRSPTMKLALGSRC